MSCMRFSEQPKNREPAIRTVIRDRCFIDMPPSDPDDDLLPPILSRIQVSGTEIDSLDGAGTSQVSQASGTTPINDNAQERRDTG